MIIFWEHYGSSSLPLAGVLEIGRLQKLARPIRERDVHTKPTPRLGD